MGNRLMKLIRKIGIVPKVVNYCNTTWRRMATTLTMDLYSLEQFKKYKKDWNYPVQVRNKEDVVVPDKKYTTFQSAIKVTLIIGQCFGLNPVLGICDSDPYKLRFKFRSWRCFYTIISMMGQFSLGLLLFASLFKESSSTVDTATSLIFYSFGFITTTLFLRIARKWPKLCMQISKMEAADPNTDTKLATKFNVSCATILSLAFVEHTMSEFYGFAWAYECEPEKPLYESFIIRSFQWIFYFLPYNDIVGFLAHFFNVQCTFNWNFTDLFVICMSIYLTSRLEQVTQRVVAAKDKNSPPSVWRTLREDYNKAVTLVRHVDAIIGSVVFISFASNLFFICSQLLHSLAGGLKANPSCPADVPDAENRRLFSGYEQSIYFAYSFLFLMIRSLAVSLTAAKVHAASLEPAHALYNVSSAAYCVEIERFLDQIHGDTVALSGLQFFHVKKGLVLTLFVKGIQKVWSEIGGFIEPFIASYPVQLWLALLHTNININTICKPREMQKNNRERKKEIVSVISKIKE